MVSALDSGASAPGSSPGRGHCVVFLGKTLYSHGGPSTDFTFFYRCCAWASTLPLCLCLCFCRSLSRSYVPGILCDDDNRP